MNLIIENLPLFLIGLRATLILAAITLATLALAPFAAAAALRVNLR